MHQPPGMIGLCGLRKLAAAKIGQGCQGQQQVNQQGRSDCHDTLVYCCLASGQAAHRDYTRWLTQMASEWAYVGNITPTMCWGWKQSLWGNVSFQQN